MRIEMYSSSADLKAGLHRVLSLAVLDPQWDEIRPWWALLPVASQPVARSGRLDMDQLQAAFCEQHATLERVRARLGVAPLTVDEVRQAFRRVVISGRAHRAHGGRDVYGASNKALWDMLVAPIATALDQTWGAAAVAEGVCDARVQAAPDGVRALAEQLVGFHTGPRDEGHDACVRWLAASLSDLGFTVRLHRHASRPSVIEAHRAPRGLTGHVVLYGHYDTVGRGGPWSTDPDQLVERDGRWYARGVADNKGPLAARLWALGTLEHTPGLSWFIQGEEETGSRHSRTVLAERVPAVRADLYLDETGYHDHQDGTLRLLARQVGHQPDEWLRVVLDGLRVVTSRHGLPTRFEERGLNKQVVAGGCPFDQSIPTGARVIALGVNDSVAGIHGVDESLPTWAFRLHREQLALLFHAVDRARQVET